LLHFFSQQANTGGIVDNCISDLTAPIVLCQFRYELTEGRYRQDAEYCGDSPRSELKTVYELIHAFS
jgi:hypothetical protein